MSRLKAVSQYLFGRRPPSSALANSKVEQEAAHGGSPFPQGSGVPRDAVSQTRGYQHSLGIRGGGFDEMSRNLKRYRLLLEMRKMAESDPRVNRILYKLSSDATAESFSINVEDAPGKRVQTQAQGILERCRFLIDDKVHLRSWVESMLRDGDLFLQLLLSGDKEIVKVQKLASEITYSRQDSKGGFPEDKKPYFQADVAHSHELLAEFDDWEIVHAKWRGEDGAPYGQPLFLSGQRPVKRVESGEEDMSIRRRLRAGLRFVFNIGTPDNPGSWEEVERFKQNNRDTLENPVNAVSNIFGNGLLDMKAIQGDSQLGNKEDIDHFEGLISMVGLTPSALISGGREQATNLNVVDAEEEDYTRTLMAICFGAEYGFLRPIFDRALSFGGLNPDSVVYSLNWGVKSRESDYRKMQKAILWLRMGYSHETAYGIADLDNDVPYETELERIQAQIDGGVIPYNGSQLGGGRGSAESETSLEPEVKM